MIVLVADDEPMVLKIATRLLEFLEHEVVQATDGQEALEILESRNDIALAILDQSMPQLTGTEVLAKLRGFLPELPVFISSGHAPMEIEDPLVTQLHKPFLLDTLEAALAKVSG
jgi:CheY-like chemotaxis protein